MTRTDPRSLRRRPRPIVAALAMAMATSGRLVLDRLALAARGPPSRQGDLPVAGYELVKTYPHDINAFTQGLEFADGVLYEGTGKYGQSRLRKVELETGKVLQETAAARPTSSARGSPSGATRSSSSPGRTGSASSSTRPTLRWVDRFRYAGEGWGLTHDATHLIMSDGTSTLRFLDPKTFRVVRIAQRDRRGPAGSISSTSSNTSTARSGRTSGTRTTSPGSPPRPAGSSAGSTCPSVQPPAGDRQQRRAQRDRLRRRPRERLFVTGKNWSELFEIKLKEPASAEPEPAEPEPAPGT